MDIDQPRNELYPRIEPYGHGMMKLDDGHEMYWEQSGNPQGRPVVFLHGGPGAGSNPTHRRFFDPTFYRIIVFDQRGAGRSTPLGDVVDNTTPHLIADIERLREMLGIERWLVFGGSWGSTLALVYAQRHPGRVTGLVLRGIFLGRAAELEWFLYGMRRVFPEAWRKFSDFIPKAERGDLLQAYHARLADPDPAVHLPAATVWSGYESACSNLIVRDSHAGGGLSLARIEAHFFVNDNFLTENQILEGAGALAAIPGIIVQGRYDMVCPISAADELTRAWPGARLDVIADAGHSAMEPGIRASLIAATAEMRQRADWP
jgi:proline iminopeptidase